MTRKVYRTAQGKTVDLGALQLQNETVRAVGNMGVNARGDLLDAYNNTIDSRTQQVSRQYQKQAGNVQDQPVAQQPDVPTGMRSRKIDIPAPPEDFDDNFEKPAETKPTGLAAAIAKAKQVVQEPVRPRKQSVKKI